MYSDLEHIIPANALNTWWRWRSSSSCGFLTFLTRPSPRPPSCDHTTWPHHIIYPCAVWRLSHRLHLDRGGRGGGMSGEYACVRSSYTSAHAQCHHGNKHLPREAEVFIFPLALSFPQRTLPTRWFTNIQNKQRENLPNYFFTDNADLLFMFPACAWISVEGEVKVGKVMGHWMLLLMERKKQTNMNKLKTKLNKNLIRAAIPNK